MFEFNLTQAFASIVVSDIASYDKNIKFGPCWTEIKENLNLTEVKVTINYTLVKFTSVGQTLSITVGNAGEEKTIHIGKDDDNFIIAEKIFAELN